MITRPVVLVLGAGASIPYGYPSGSELRQQIIDELSDGSEGAHGQTDHEDVGLRKCLLANGFHERQIWEFARVLNDSQTMSVDVFLEQSSNFIDLGKQAIAWKLLQCDDKSRHFRQDDGRWYHYLWGLMEASFDDFGKNPVTIITYNYDLSLERHLLSRIAALYGKSSEESVAKLHEIKIIHLHGKVGNFCRSRNFEDMTAYEVREAANDIKIVHESIGTDVEYIEAREVMSTAKEIHFLGFGYNKTNLHRLFLNMPEVWRPKIYGTTLKMGDSERQAAAIRIKSYIHSPHISISPQLNSEGDAKYDVLGHLRNRFRHY